jgi:hypothetical protein
MDHRISSDQRQHSHRGHQTPLHHLNYGHRQGKSCLPRDSTEPDLMSRSACSTLDWLSREVPSGFRSYLATTCMPTRLVLGRDTVHSA